MIVTKKLTDIGLKWWVCILWKQFEGKDCYRKDLLLKVRHNTKY